MVLQNIPNVHLKIKTTYKIISTLRVLLHILQFLEFSINHNQYKKFIGKILISPNFIRIVSFLRFGNPMIEPIISSRICLEFYLWFIPKVLDIRISDNSQTFIDIMFKETLLPSVEQLLLCGFLREPIYLVVQWWPVVGRPLQHCYTM